MSSTTSDTSDTSNSSQYTLEEQAAKSVNMTTTATFQFSPDSGNDWWSSLKSEIGSPKDGWSSDSDSSQHTIICQNGNGNMLDGENGHSMEFDGTMGLNSTSDGISNGKKKKKSKETPAVNKPAQVVARRNARERRRVQAVNWAFQRLRKVVPLEENKSKRMSKVKTLQLAIEYINQLQSLLQFTTQHSNEADLLADIFSDLQQQQQQVKMETNDFTFRVPPGFYSHLIGENDEN